MRKITPFLVVTLILLGISFSPVLAQGSPTPELFGDAEAQVDTGIKPDSPFYFLDNFWKSVRLTFTFNQTRKIERRMEFARERLAEAEEMSKENKVEAMEKALGRYEKQIQHAEEKIVKRTELADKVAEMTAKHLEILERVIDKAPENAKAGLEKALEASEKGHVRAIQILEITNMTKAREFSARNIRQIKVRVEKQVQERKEQMKQDSENLQIRTRERIEKNIEDTKRMMEELRKKQSLDIKNRLELLEELGGQNETSFDYRPQELNYKIKENGILLTWKRPLNHNNVASYKIHTKSWGIAWKEIVDTKSESYLLKSDMSHNICNLDIRITSVLTGGKIATYFPAFIHNIDYVANKDTWQKDCGPQF